MRGLGAPSSWHWLVEGDRCCLGSRAGRQASQTSAAMQRWLQLASRRSNARAEPSDQIRSRCCRPRRSYQTKRPTPRPEAGPEALARQPDQTNRRPGVQRSRKQSRRQTTGLSHTRQPRRNKSRPRQRQPAQPRRSTSAALASRRQISHHQPPATNDGDASQAHTPAAQAPPEEEPPDWGSPDAEQKPAQPQQSQSKLSRQCRRRRPGPRRRRQRRPSRRPRRARQRQTRQQAADSAENALKLKRRGKAGSSTLFVSARV